MNDMYTQRGPGIDLPAYTGPERRGSLADRRQAVAISPNLLTLLLAAAYGFVIGLGVEALWIYWR